jgi:hypothetical protein
MPETHYSVADAGTLLGVSERRARQLLTEGHLSSVTNGMGRLRIPGSSLDAERARRGLPPLPNVVDRRKRRSGAGSVRETVNGRWEARWREGGRRRSKTFDSEVAALRHLEASQRSSGTPLRKVEACCVHEKELNSTAAALEEAQAQIRVLRLAVEALARGA